MEVLCGYVLSEYALCVYSCLLIMEKKKIWSLRVSSCMGVCTENFVSSVEFFCGEYVDGEKCVEKKCVFVLC